MKKTLLTLIFCFVALQLNAQRFTDTNSYGTPIYYYYNQSSQTISVDTGSYTGRVVIPDSVVYNGDTLPVTEIANAAFSRSGITYVSLPSPMRKIGLYAFMRCSQLDTLEFRSQTPPVAGSRVGSLPNYNADLCFSSHPDITLIVPCGSLRQYRQSPWGTFRKLQSPCSYQITVLPSDTSVIPCVIFDSINWRYYQIIDNNRSSINGTSYTNSYYEIGDTATLICRLWDNSCSPLFLGWNKAVTTLPNYAEVFLAVPLSGAGYVVTGPDTVIGYCVSQNYGTLAANNISTSVSSLANMGYKEKTANYRVAEDTAATIFSTGLWIGGLSESGTLHCAVQRYGTEGTDYYPGPLRITDATTSPQTSMRYNKVWHITRDMIDNHIAQAGNPGYSAPDDILTWPGNGDTSDGYAAQLAPYYDADSNGIYTPLAGDYPIIRGDEALFMIFNDNAGKHNESRGNPLGVEIHAMFYAFNEPTDTAMNNTVFAHYDIYNRSDSNYRNTYLGAFMDMDIGHYASDYVGCDVARGMFYGYKGIADTITRDMFHGRYPAQSCAILGGAYLPPDGIDNPAIGIGDTISIADTTGSCGINGMGYGNGIADDERIGMTNFVAYLNNISSVIGDPNNATNYYNYMRTRAKTNGSRLSYGNDGTRSDSTSIPCNFMYPADSDPWHWGTNGIDPGFGWTETLPDTTTPSYPNNPGDRRGVGSTGPFTFNAGTMQQLDLAYTTAFTLDASNLFAAVVALGYATDNVRRQFAHDTTDSGKPFTYMPYSAPHTVGMDAAQWNDTPIAVYPNPTTGTVTISNIPSAGKTKIQLFGISGLLLYERTATSSRETLSLAGLKAGIYVIKVGNHVFRIVKK